LPAAKKTINPLLVKDRKHPAGTLGLGGHFSILAQSIEALHPIVADVPD
jgi:hypothetical protein